MKRRIVLSLLALLIGYLLDPWRRLAAWRTRWNRPIEDRGWVDPYEADWRG